ncbi:hypothetical protein [Brevibacillus laterosporus]|uniref:hypothetical protein n=1 Tax=Brevibacillus laterosporus TaxID=1465 RepID=UPI0026547628|nr:hypothetical protein [Brevibacillus laterosporus]MDN9011095.1 hypothetical protein [Brevibacillus laterosporus]MDO0942118.1 hypothetical protein [Brevibacillus laterosporus]
MKKLNRQEVKSYRDSKDSKSIKYKKYIKEHIKTRIGTRETHANAYICARKEI